jgi:hypothetical protein
MWVSGKFNLPHLLSVRFSCLSPMNSYEKVTTVGLHSEPTTIKKGRRMSDTNPGIAALAFVAWHFLTHMNAGMESFLRLFSLVVSAAYLAHSFRNSAVLVDNWPLLLALLWACLWPALEFWGRTPWPFDSNEATLWWADWYTRWGGFVGIIGLGYALTATFGDWRATD